MVEKTMILHDNSRFPYTQSKSIQSNRELTIFHYYSREIMIHYDFRGIQLNWLKSFTIYQNLRSQDMIRFFLINIHLLLLIELRSYPCPNYKSTSLPDWVLPVSGSVLGRGKVAMASTDLGQDVNNVHQNRRGLRDSTPTIGHPPLAHVSSA